MKNPLYKLSFLAFLFIVSFITVKAQCLPGWKYNMPIAVVNNTFASLTDYQVKINLNTATPIGAGKMISTGDDIRFVDANSCHLLNYWIESGIGGANTVIWVKMAILPASSTRTIMMYYGNSSATAASNGDSTFIIFDDFLGTTLNTAKWSSFTNGGSMSVANGNLTFTATATGKNTTAIRSVNSFPAPIIVEGNFTTANNFYPSLGMVNSGSFEGYDLNFGNYSGSGIMYLTSLYPSGGTYAGNAWVTSTSPGNLTGIWQVSWPSSNIQSGSWPGGNLSWTNNTIPLSNSVQIVSGLQYWSQNSSMSLDWIRGRNYAPSEATTSVGNEHSTGIENELQLYNIRIFPNPAHDVLNIDLKSSNVDFETLQLIDLKGNKINNIVIAGKKDNIELQVSKIVKGLYFVKLTGKNGVLTQKITIE